MTTDQSGQRLRGWLREASTHSLVYGLGAALQAALNFLLLPVYTAQFPAEEFGVFRMAVTAAALAGAVCYLGAYSSLSRFYFDPEEPAERRTVAGTAALVTLLGAGLQMLFVLLASRRLSEVTLGTSAYGPYFVVAFATSAVTFVNQIFLLMLRLNRRSIVVVIVTLCSVLVTAAAIPALMLVWRWGVMGALQGALIGQAAVTPLLIWLTRRDFVWGGTRPHLRQHLAFGLPTVAIGLGYYALDSADRFVLARFNLKTDLGIYSFGYSIGMVVQMLFVQPFVQIWNPMRLEYRKHAEAGRLTALLTTYYALAGLAIVAALSLFARELVAILGRRAEYAPAARVIPIILLSHLAYGAINLVDTGIIATNRLIYHVALFWGSLVVNVGLNYWLVPRYGYMGSAWATLVSYLLLVGAVYAISHSLMPNHIEPARLVMAVTTAVSVIVVRAWLPLSGLAAVAVEAGLLGGLLAVWYGWVLSSSERAWFRHPRLRAAE